MSNLQKRFDSNRKMEKQSSSSGFETMNLEPKFGNNSLAEMREEINFLKKQIDRQNNGSIADDDSLNDVVIGLDPDFSTMGRIPDIVKDIPLFSGDQTTFVQWIDDVDGVVELFSQFKSSHQYKLVLKTIRRKIVGDANKVLINKNALLSWKDMREKLLMHYGDKRDIITLTTQVVCMTRKNDTIETFYAKVQEAHSLLSNCILLDKEFRGSEPGLMVLYSRLCLDTFVRGVGGNLSQFLKNYQPKSLAHAYQYALEFRNTEFRTEIQIPSTIPEVNPNKQTFQRYQQPSFPKNQRQFENKRFDNKPSQDFKKNYSNQYQEPMEVDRSIRSKMADYQRRPPLQYQQKGTVRQAIDTPSFRKQAPQMKKTAHMAQLNPGNDNETEEQLKSYLNMAEENAEYDKEDNEEFYEEHEGNTNFFHAPDQENSDLTNKSYSPIIEINLGKTKLKFLLDTGASTSFINANVFNNETKLKKSLKIQTAGGTVSAMKKAESPIFFPFNKTVVKFIVSPCKLPFTGILGTDIMEKLNANINLPESKFIIPGKIYKIKKFPCKGCNSVTIRDTHMNEKEKTILKNILQEFPNIFQTPDSKLTFTTRVKATIRTTDNDPVYIRSYPYPYGLKDEVEKQINKMLKDGIISPSKSPFNSPLWVVNKKLDASGERKYRIVIDFKTLNSKTIADKYPMPEIAAVLADLKNNNYFSTLDLAMGFYQVELKREDREKTAFSVNNGKYEFNRLPMGLKNSPSIFQRVMDDVLRDYIGKICHVYIDDIIVFGSTLEEHGNNLKTILQALSNANFKIQPDKSEFFKKQVEFLGFTVNKEGIKPSESKIIALKEYPEPTNLRELRSFLGLSSYYRRFVIDYAKLARPLTKLLKGEGGHGQISKNQSKKYPIKFNDEQRETFIKLKDILTSDDVLVYPDFNREFHLTTDACDYAIGAVLSQGIIGKDRPITFISRTLSSTEENYATNEKEMLAIIWSLQKLRNYLYTAKINILTDHQPLTFALSNKNTNSKMKRWKAILEEYDYKLIYKPGSTNVVADALSRYPVLVNALTSTAHSSPEDDSRLILSSEAPINSFKNQIFIELGDENGYDHETPFANVHRHNIKINNLNEETLKEIITKYFSNGVINGIYCAENIMGSLQEVYSDIAITLRAKYTQTLLTDVTDHERQETITFDEHKRAHRNYEENKNQISRKFYWPKMAAFIKNLVLKCQTCQISKYTRHPDKPTFQMVPVPTRSAQIYQVDLFTIEREWFITLIDTFTKFAMITSIKSRSIADVKNPFMELISRISLPEIIVMDNEPSLKSSVIRLKLQELNVNVYETPTGRSEVNGQIERLHSTLTEIYRCIKTDGNTSSVRTRLRLSVEKYNNSIHSVINMTPHEALLGRKGNFQQPLNANEIREKNDALILSKLKMNQDKKRIYQNKKRSSPVEYKEGDLALLKNKQIISKHVNPKKEITIKANQKVTVLDPNDHKFHKSDLIKKKI